MIDPDRLLGIWMEGLTVFHRKKIELGLSSHRWKPGEKLRLMFAGYNGSRNTGADVRVHEMIRQVRHVLGEGRSDLSVLTIDPMRTQGYFGNATQVTLPQVFPHFIYSHLQQYDGVVACEGSMFKSKFANALSIMMAGSLGMANAEKKLSVGYGAEVGAMTPDLEAFVRRSCRESLVLCRNEPSRKHLEKLGIRSLGGTDTAWTFEPAAAEVGRKHLMDQGWDGKKEILFVCPINPFWWPVKPSLSKWLSHALFRKHADTHYKSIYFHEYDEEKKAKYRSYLRALVSAITTLEKSKDVFVALVAMEALDERACKDLESMSGRSLPSFFSANVNMYEMVSVLRQGAYMISSRFHAVVTSMGGLVAPIGVTMDERLRNVLTDAGLASHVFEVDQPDLEKELGRAILDLVDSKKMVQAKIRSFLPSQFEKMGRMGLDFLDEVERVYPEFKRESRPKTWKDALPHLSPDVEAMLHAPSEVKSA